MIPTDLRLNWWYLNFYYFGSKLILIELIPYFVMIWMNFQIWKRIQAIINNEQPNQPESSRGKFFLHFYYIIKNGFNISNYTEKASFNYPK